MADNPHATTRGRNVWGFAPRDGQALDVLLMAHELGKPTPTFRSEHANSDVE